MKNIRAFKGSRFVSSEFAPSREKRYRLTRADLLSLIWTMEHDRILNAPIEKIAMLKQILVTEYKLLPSCGRRSKHTGVRVHG